MISFVIPAHDEAALIGRTLAAIHESARAVGLAYEIIVADDGSTDRTAAIAREHGASVVRLDRRQIAAARNAGARAARGEVLVFVDADTQITPRVLRAAMRALGRGAVGGGSAVRFDGRVPLYAEVLQRALPIFLNLLGMVPGCFIFCTRTAYLGAGGFDEARYWAEEVGFAKRLRRQGRLAILREFVITSGRKVRSHSLLEMLRVGVRLLRGRRDAGARGRALAFWYGPRAAEGER